MRGSWSQAVSQGLQPLQPQDAGLLHPSASCLLDIWVFWGRDLVWKKQVGYLKQSGGIKTSETDNCLGSSHVTEEDNISDKEDSEA